MIRNNTETKEQRNYDAVKKLIKNNIYSKIEDGPLNTHYPLCTCTHEQQNKCATSKVLMKV